MVVMFLFYHSQIVESITGYLNISTDPATFIQVRDAILLFFFFFSWLDIIVFYALGSNSTNPGEDKG